jgi:hypothetical protein
MLQLLMTLGAGFIGFVIAHTFVRRRLRFVDGIHSPMAPLIAGIAAAAIAGPAAVLPFITLTTAIVFGVGIALGTASGSRALRHAAGNHHRLTP